MKLQNTCTTNTNEIDKLNKNINILNVTIKQLNDKNENLNKIDIEKSNIIQVYKILLYIL